MEKYEVYWKLAESEQHFNELQAGIRNRASTWLLAAFTAIALLIKTGAGTTWLVPSSLLIGLVCLMGSIGLLVLWINDQMVYHRLLNSVFLVGLKMEYDNPGLPPVKALMMHSAEGKGMHRWLSYYYLIPILFFILVSLSVAILRQHIDISSRDQIITQETTQLVIVIFIVLQAGIFIWIRFQRSRVTTQQRAALFGDEGFVDLFTGDHEQCMKNFGKIIKNYHLYKANLVQEQYESNKDEEEVSVS